MSLIKGQFESTESVEIQKAIKENTPIGNRLAYTGHPISHQKRININISITDLYKVKVVPTGDSIYCFAAEKKYNKPKDFSDSSCEGISYYTGFIRHRTGGDYTILKHNFFLTDCDMKYVINSIPLGAVIIQNQLFGSIRKFQQVKWR